MDQKMKNAPVYFTIAQVRHNPVLCLGHYAADIQDRMRKEGYPDFKKGESMAVTLPQPENVEQPQLPVVEKVERLMFFDSSSTRGFIVEQNAISFYTTQYATFEAFADEFMRGLVIVQECVRLDYLERIGLRYLNAVVPPNGEVGLGDYLVPSVLGLNSYLPEEIGVAYSSSETHFRIDDRAIRARTTIWAGPLGFPIDLRPIGVRLAEQFRNINGVHAVVDVDASIEGRRTFELELILAQLQLLRDGIGIAFRATVTQQAISTWIGQTQGK